MARQELKRRLEELDMSAAEARGYGELLTATQAHLQSLHNLLECEQWPTLPYLPTIVMINDVALQTLRPRKMSASG